MFEKMFAITGGAKVRFLSLFASFVKTFNRRKMCGKRKALGTSKGAYKQ